MNIKIPLRSLLPFHFVLFSLFFPFQAFATKKKCKGGKRWVPRAKKCLCPSRKRWDKKLKRCDWIVKAQYVKCGAANSERDWTRTACVCKKNYLVDKTKTKCVLKCTGGANWNFYARRCVCPLHHKWLKSKKKCVLECPSGTTWSTREKECKCKQKGYNYSPPHKKCIKCKRGMVFNKKLFKCACRDDYWWATNVRKCIYRCGKNGKWDNHRKKCYCSSRLYQWNPKMGSCIKKFGKVKCRYGMTYDRRKMKCQCREWEAFHQGKKKCVRKCGSTGRWNRSKKTCYCASGFQRWDPHQRKCITKGGLNKLFRKFEKH